MIETYQTAIDRYLEKSASGLIGAALIYDYAISAEKMLSWQCVGTENEAWKTGPYLSAGADDDQIDRSHPYCLRISLETQGALWVCLEEKPELNVDGGFRAPIPPSVPGTWSAEPYVAKMAIIEQFELYKVFASETGAPMNEKTSKHWAGRIDDRYLDLLRDRTNRRNALTHELLPTPPTMREAVEFGHIMRIIAGEAWKALNRAP